jgi:hypothetical protein
LDRTNDYTRQLDQFTEHAAVLIGQIKDREALLKDIINSSGEEIRNAYVREARDLVDRIAERRLAEAEKEEATPGALLMKGVAGALAVIATRKSPESQLARDFQEPAIQSYRMDETIKKRIIEVSAVLKRRIKEETSAMELGDFLKSLKGGKAMHKSLNAMFGEELDRFP